MTEIDKGIIETFKSFPYQMIRVKFTFDGKNEHFTNNAIITDNYFKKFGSKINSRTRQDDKVIVDAEVQAFLCETLSSECISLISITKIRRE
jgi:cystathionine beta-lyase/cystathionine gamma-synthase